jgi:futalosine hydrolase
MGEKILLVTATAFEVKPALEFLGIQDKRAEGLGVPGAFVESRNVDCLVTGVGQLQCASRLMEILCKRDYKFVLQAGLAGSFSERYRKRAVVEVVEEILADFGAEGDGIFLDICDMGLLPKDSHPFTDGILKLAQPLDIGVLCLPQVRSVTVNRTLADPKSIGWVSGRYSPDVVNMEGAALFYVCLTRGVPFVELRSISDMVGPRDKSSWDIKGGIEALNVEVIKILDLLVLKTPREPAP